MPDEDIVDRIKRLSQPVPAPEIAQPPGVAMGLGPHFAPAAGGYEIIRVELMGGPHVIVKFTGVSGTFACTFDLDGVKRFINDLQANSTPLIVARP